MAETTSKEVPAAQDPVQTQVPAKKKKLFNLNDDGDLNEDDVRAALESYVPGSEEEKKLVRRIDFILLPILWWMYILAYLDRGNIVSFHHDRLWVNPWRQTN